MATYIYRDFSRGDRFEYYTLMELTPPPDYLGSPTFHGQIEMTLLNCHQIQLQLMGLQESEEFEDESLGQADVRITLDPSIDLYTAIMTILDKITADFQYRLRGRDYQDFVMCTDEFAQEHPELCCNDPIAGPYDGGYWMKFTPETLPYVHLCEETNVHESLEHEILIRGEVTMAEDEPEGIPQFTYDYPIVSRNVGREVYNVSRGKCVWDII